MNESAFETTPIQNVPETGITEATQSFDLKIILMILTGSNLGESHIATRIRDVVNHVIGDATSLESPEDVDRALEATVEAILLQYPELSALHADGGSTTTKIAAWLTSDIPNITISLKSPASH